MGLSASQARFLQLTARRSDVEYQCQQICQERLMLSQQLTAASTEYNDALSNKKLVFTYTNDKVNKVDITYSNYINYMNQQLDGLVTSQQKLYLVSTSGKLVVGSTADRDKMIEDNITYVKASDVQAAKEAQEPTQEQEKLLMTDWSKAGVVSKNENGEDVLYYIQSQKFSNDDFIIVSDLDNNDLFQQAIKDGTYYFATLGTEGDNKDKLVIDDWVTIGNAAIHEEADETDDTKAEAKYNDISRRIETVDKKLQMSMDQLETERESIQTEMDSVSKVMEDNIEKTFDTFS